MFVTHQQNTGQNHNIWCDKVRILRAKLINQISCVKKLRVYNKSKKIQVNFSLQKQYLNLKIRYVYQTRRLLSGENFTKYKSEVNKHL